MLLGDMEILFICIQFISQQKIIEEYEFIYNCQNWDFTFTKEYFIWEFSFENLL